MKLLRIAKELDLPLDAVTQKLAWLGRTGSGKTFACKRMVEQMLYAGAQVVIIDAAGVWPGLRLGPHSFDIPVLSEAKKSAFRISRSAPGTRSTGTSTTSSVTCELSSSLRGRGSVRISEELL